MVPPCCSSTQFWSLQKTARDGPTSREETKGYGPHNLAADGGQISPEIIQLCLPQNSDFP